MFLIQKYTQYKAAQAEQQKRKVTEKELAQLNHKIDKLLSKLDEHEPEVADSQDDECVVCVNAKATMQTYPCGHRVVCRKCFVKTIQMAVAQRLLPLRCVLCRAKILRLKHSSGAPLTTSASQYTIGSQWYHVPQSASLYSVTSSTSGISGVSGVSSASSCSSASSYKTCASSFSSASLKKRSYSKQGYQPLRTSSPSPSRSPHTRSGISISKKDHHRVAPIEAPPPIPISNGGGGGNGQQHQQLPPAKGKLSLIQEFQREFRNGKTKTVNERKGSGGSQRGGSTRIKCARLLVNQASCNNPPMLGTTTGKVTLESGIRRGDLGRGSSSSVASSSGGSCSNSTLGSKTNSTIAAGGGFRRATPPPSSQSCHSFRLSRHDSVTPAPAVPGLKKGKHNSLQEIEKNNSEDAKKYERSMPVSNETTKLDKGNGGGGGISSNNSTNSNNTTTNATIIANTTPTGNGVIPVAIPPPQTAKKLSNNNKK